MSLNVVDVSTLTVAGTSIGLSDASPSSSTVWASGARQALIIVEGAPVYMRSDGDAATSSDVLLNVGDAVPILGDDMLKTIDNLRFIRKTSTSATLKIIWYNRQAVLTERVIRGTVRLVTEAGDSLSDDTSDAIKALLVAGTATIGKLGANSGVDIGDVDVTSIITGTGATNLGKAEDAAHSSGDTGVMALSVRRDVPTQEAGTEGDYTPIHSDRLGRTRISPSSIFGKPYLRAEGKANAKWEKTPDFGDMRDAPFGWRARLFGGSQSGDDWAAVEIPVDEMPMNKLSSMQIMYEDEVNETYGIGITLFVHDPNEHDSRAEISLYTSATGGHTPPDSAQGWNYYELSTASTGYFWYGNNCVGSGLTEGLPNIYTIAQYQADALFSTFTIYRIEVFHGWAGSGECDDCWVGSIHINKEAIPLLPPAEEILGQVFDEVSKSLQVRPGWLFGKPTLLAANNGDVRWVKGETSPLDQKGASGWLANLYGGTQTGDDWARINIPVNELPLGELKSALWTYYMTNAETFGVNIVVWIHDPTDNSKRAEVTQLGNIATLEKAQGWNNHELVLTTDQFFFYGEGTTGTGLTAGPPNYYGIDDFQADALFKNWTIYRITIEYGWEASGTFEDAYVADLKLNGIVIALEPSEADLQWLNKKQVSTAKALDAAVGYTAEDVLCEDDDNGEGTAWSFPRIAPRGDGSSGCIRSARILLDRTAMAPRLTLYLFNATPTSELDDNAANTAVAAADVAKYVGKIDFPAMEDLGGDSDTLATTSTYGNLPVDFKCAAGADDLYGILVTRDAFTATHSDNMTITLIAEAN